MRRQIILVALVLTPFILAAGQTPTPIGFILETGRARVGATDAAAGGTIHSGDTLRTERDSALWLAIRGAKFVLLENSGATIHASGQGLVIDVEQGTVVFSSPAGTTHLEIWVSDVRVSSQGSGAFLGEVSLLGSCEARVTSQVGPLIVAIDKTPQVVREKTSFRFTPRHAIGNRGPTRIPPNDPRVHQDHTHKPCPPVSPVAEPASLEKVLPVAFVTGGTAAALLLRSNSTGLKPASPVVP